ncbi:MAG: transcription termination/antitermination protein NusG [Clostridiaceae bacterium]|jgi:transcriptional antiterminator NusG|nr:transcription termination/antitermination protein NusG [Clostridiaceae bacterium]
MENIDQAKWYVLHTYSGYEGMVEDNLHNMVENNSLQDYIFEVKVPVEDEVVEKNGKKKLVQRKKFPSYVFIKMIYTNHIWFMVTNTRGVTGFVGPAGRPLPLTADEVKRMGLEVITADEFDIKSGDNVRIISGALESFIGVVELVAAERQKVKVIVSMFGRQTPVELDFSQVEKI